MWLLCLYLMLTSQCRNLKDFCHHPQSKLHAWTIQATRAGCAQSCRSDSQSGRREGGVRMQRCICAALQKTRVIRQPSLTEVSIPGGLISQQHRSCHIPSQAGSQGTLNGKVCLHPAVPPPHGTQPATATAALIMEEPEWPGAPCFKHCTCHMVINGCGISFDRNSMAWNRLCASLLCLRQSAY